MFEHPLTLTQGTVPQVQSRYPLCIHPYQVYLEGEQPIPASVVEQLSLMPAVTVTSLSMPPCGTGGLLGSSFPSTASAGIHLCLPPGTDYLPAVKAFQAHCAQVRGAE